MNTKNSICFIVALAISSLFSSCYKDLGNYDYIDNNKILQISDIAAQTTRTVVLGQEVRVTPAITWKYPDRDTTANAFEFRWEFNDSVVSNERNLRFTPTKIQHQAPCYLFVTEKTTGITTIHTGHITITSPFKTGWLILSESGSNSILSFIRRDTKTNDKNEKYNEYVEYKDLYSTLFPGTTLGTNPKKLSYVQITGDKDEILVLQEPDQCVYLSGDDFSKYIYLKDEFPGKQYPQGYKPADFVDAAQCTYVSGEDGVVYWKISPSFYGKLHLTQFIPVPLTMPGGLKVGFFPNIRITSSQFAPMYDTLNNRLLMCYTSFNSGGGHRMGTKIEITNNEKPADVVDVNNMGDYQLVYMGGEHPSFIMLLKQNSTGDYYYYTFSIQGSTSSFNVRVTNHKQLLFPGSTFISDESVFHKLRRSAYLFFSNGSKLYFYDQATGNVKLYHDFQTGKIVKIDADAPETEIGVAFDNGDMYVCSASVAVLGASNPGQEGGILHHATGLGRIVDMIWKYGGYYNYIFQRY